jgi:hypothetical protein
MPPNTPQPPTLIQNVEQVLPIDEIFPTSALLLGGAVLLGVVLLHGVVMHWVQTHVAARDPFLVLLGAGLLEVTVWTAALKYSSIFPTWVGAAAFSASSYTTLGNATRSPPPGWSMLGPIIAMSGLFTFGWSGSVLVEVVRRVSQARDGARSRPAS